MNKASQTGFVGTYMDGQIVKDLHNESTSPSSTGAKVKCCSSLVQDSKESLSLRL